MSPERLTLEDAAILALESPAIAGHTCKLIVLEPPGVTVSRLRDHVAARLDAAPRLRQRLAPAPAGLAPPAWVDDDGFDIARHVRRAVGGPIAPAALPALVAGVMRERLDRAHPLWAMDVVEELEGGGSALVWRIHHAMADGTMAVRLAEAVLWDREPAPAGEGSAQAPAPGAAALLADAVLWRAARLGGDVAGLARGLVSPRAWRAAAGELARLPGAAARDLRRGREPSPLDAHVSGRREVGFASVPLDGLKRIEHAQPQRTTVNDVVLALVGGALRRWTAHHGAASHELRVKVPVSLHDRDAHAADVGNRDSFLCLGLPLDEPDPVARLRAIAAETRERKREHDAETIDELFQALRHAPRPVARLGARLAAGPRTFALNVSNVPGPPDARSLAGARVAELRTLAEVAEHHALRVSAISYAGVMSLGLCADPTAVDGLEVIAAGMEQEAADLLAASTPS